MSTSADIFKNPQMDGNEFFWPGGPTGVLLVHGFTATTAEVRPLARLLHEEGYTIGAPLLPGHNATPEDLNQTHWQDWYNTVSDMYRRLAIQCQRVVVGGESTGGVLALLLASRQPDIAAVLAYAPALRLKITLLDTLRLYLASPFMPYIPKQSPDDELPWQGYRVLPLRAVTQLLALQRITRRRLPAIDQPVLVAQGRHDDAVHPDVPDMIIRGVSSQITEIHWLENSRHVIVLDKEMDDLAQLTINFLEKRVFAAA